MDGFRRGRAGLEEMDGFKRKGRVKKRRRGLKEMDKVK